LQTLREVDLRAIEREITTPVPIVVAAENEQVANDLATALFGPDSAARSQVTIRSLTDLAALSSLPDLALVFVPSVERLSGAFATTRGPLAESAAIVIVVPAGLEPRHPATPERTIVVAVRALDAETLSRELPPRRLALDRGLAARLARRSPVFRSVVADDLIQEASRNNAQLAFLTSLPANIPVVGGLAGDAADAVLLTKNQAVLVYKLAGLYGRDLRDKRRLAMEIVPVIGGAFLWRSLARSLLGLLPTAVGGLSKTAVAYVGTYTVGQMARYYYAEGVKPGTATVARFQEEGARRFGDVVERLKRLRSGA
ncbi:MAG: hypothetical protein IT307_14270, partial [Chloroflexi bacterium]|nr:hypothetical protein [Chloroflexota bacterium]